MNIWYKYRQIYAIIIKLKQDQVIPVIFLILDLMDVDNLMIYVQGIPARYVDGCYPEENLISVCTEAVRDQT